MIQSFSLIGLIMGLLISLVLILFSMKKGTSNWLLGLSMLFLWYALLMTELYRTGKIIDFAHLSRTGNLIGFLITPFLYLFTKQIFYREKPWLNNAWWIFLPTVLYFLDFSPYFFSSFETKRNLVFSQQFGDSHFAFSEGVFTPDWVQYYFRQVWSLLFMGFTLSILWKNKYILKNNKSRKNQALFSFILILTLLYGVSLFPAFFLNYFGESWYNLSYQSVTVSFTLTVTAIFLIFNPQYLYGFYWEDELVINKVPINDQDNKNEISSQGDESICSALKKFLQEHKSYLDPAYSINDLSKEIGIPVYKISPAINTCHGINFNTWLNEFRIKEFEEIILAGDFQKYNLEGLASKCGFSNRTTFNNACKKITGHTPGNFLKLRVSENTL